MNTVMYILNLAPNIICVTSFCSKHISRDIVLTKRAPIAKSICSTNKLLCSSVNERAKHNKEIYIQNRLGCSLTPLFYYYIVITMSIRGPMKQLHTARQRWHHELGVHQTA